jgi:hypothetical protein
MTDIKHTRADEVKPGRREITVANAIDIVHDDITFDAIHGTKSQLKEINQTLLLILKQLQHITGEKE